MRPAAPANRRLVPPPMMDGDRVAEPDLVDIPGRSVVCELEAGGDEGHPAENPQRFRAGSPEGAP